MMEAASDEKVQKNYAKVVEWYGGKDAVKEVLKNRPESEVFKAYQKRIDDIQKSLEELRLGDEKSLSCLTAPMSGFYKTMRLQPNLTKNSKICKLRLVDRWSLLFYD